LLIEIRQILKSNQE